MKVNFNQKFGYAPFLNRDIGFETTIPDNATEDQMIEEIVRLHRIATKAHEKLPSELQETITDFNTGQSEKIREVNLEAERVEVEIDNATSIEELDKLLDKAIIYNLKEAFTAKQCELKNKQLWK